MMETINTVLLYIFIIILAVSGYFFHLSLTTPGANYNKENKQ